MLDKRTLIISQSTFVEEDREELDEMDKIEKNDCVQFIYEQKLEKIKEDIRKKFVEKEMKKIEEIIKKDEEDYVAQNLLRGFMKNKESGLDEEAANIGTSLLMQKFFPTEKTLKEGEYRSKYH